MHDPRDDGDTPEEAFAGHTVLRALEAGGEAQLHVVRLRSPVDGHELGVLKRLPADRLADARARARLVAEGRLGTRVRAPQLVRTLGYGVHDGPGHEPFVVLELVDGPHLAALTAYALRRRDPLPMALRVFILAEVARGLGALHRDVTPQNILIAIDGTVKLADLGLALPLHSAGRRKRTAAPAGSAAYMAPEQRHGEPLDARTDLFALGVVGLELLLGRRLLTERRTPMLAAAGGIVPAEVLAAAHQAEPGLAALLATLVAAAQLHRPHDAASVAHTLEEWLCRAGVPDGRTALSAWMLRHKLALSLRAAVLTPP